MENTILYSSAGITETLVALPVNDRIGGTQWNFQENPSCAVKQIAQIPHPTPTPNCQTIAIYSATCKTESCVQRFQEVQGGVHLPLPLVHGAISMITHPVSTTQSIHANLPVGGVEQQPLLICVRDNSGSTGYHWEQSPSREAGLKTASHYCPPDSKAVGAAGFRVFELTAEESGTYTVQLHLMPPAGKQPVSTIVVTLHAINA